MKKVLSPKEAEKIQNEIFRKMSVEKKLNWLLKLMQNFKNCQKENEIAVS